MSRPKSWRSQLVELRGPCSQQLPRGIDLSAEESRDPRQGGGKSSYFHFPLETSLWGMRRTVNDKIKAKCVAASTCQIPWNIPDGGLSEYLMKIRHLFYLYLLFYRSVYVFGRLKALKNQFKKRGYVSMYEELCIVLNLFTEQKSVIVFKRGVTLFIDDKNLLLCIKTNL